MRTGSIHGANLAAVEPLHNQFQQLVLFWGNLLIGCDGIEDLLLFSAG